MSKISLQSTIATDVELQIIEKLKQSRPFYIEGGISLYYNMELVVKIIPIDAVDTVGILAVRSVRGKRTIVGVETYADNVSYIVTPKIIQTMVEVLSNFKDTTMCGYIEGVKYSLSFSGDVAEISNERFTLFSFIKSSVTPLGNDDELQGHLMSSVTMQSLMNDTDSLATFKSLAEKIQPNVLECCGYKRKCKRTSTQVTYSRLLYLLSPLVQKDSIIDVIKKSSWNENTASSVRSRMISERLVELQRLVTMGLLPVVWLEEACKIITGTSGNISFKEANFIIKMVSDPTLKGM